MKAFFVLAGFVLLAAACSNECELTVVENNGEQTVAPVTVRVDDFSVTQEEIPSGGGMTRSVEEVADYKNVKAMTLAFYSEGKEVYKQTQLKDDHTTYITFGEFSCNLPVGSYTMVVVGRDHYKDDVFVLTSPTEADYTSERPRETFTKTQTVTIASATPVNFSVALDRVNAQLQILSTDTRPEEAKTIKTTYSKGSKGFSPTSGLATDDNGFWVTNTPAAVGKTINVISNAFLATDLETMTITIQTLDADGHVLVTKVVPNVPLQRNCKTVLTGTVFTGGSGSGAFRLETSWLTDISVDF